MNALAFIITILQLLPEFYISNITFLKLFPQSLPQHYMFMFMFMFPDSFPHFLSLDSSPQMITSTFSSSNTEHLCYTY